jgi:hypothetical protein
MDPSNIFLTWPLALTPSSPLLFGRGFCDLQIINKSQAQTFPSIRSADVNTGVRACKRPSIGCISCLLPPTFTAALHFHTAPPSAETADNHDCCHRTKGGLWPFAGLYSRPHLKIQEKTTSSSTYSFDSGSNTPE